MRSVQAKIIMSGKKVAYQQPLVQEDHRKRHISAPDKQRGCSLPSVDEYPATDLKYIGPKTWDYKTKGYSTLPATFKSSKSAPAINGQRQTPLSLNLQRQISSPSLNGPKRTASPTMNGQTKSPSSSPSRKSKIPSPIRNYKSKIPSPPLTERRQSPSPLAISQRQSSSPSLNGQRKSTPPTVNGERQTTLVNGQRQSVSSNQNGDRSTPSPTATNGHLLTPPPGTPGQRLTPSPNSMTRPSSVSSGCGSLDSKSEPGSSVRRRNKQLSGSSSGSSGVYSKASRDETPSSDSKLLSPDVKLPTESFEWGLQ